jgi:hypothetical protein
MAVRGMDAPNHRRGDVKSDPKRIDEALRHVEQIKGGTYPVVVGNPGRYQIDERPWADMPDRNKLAILRGAVDWTGITNRDQAHVLLSEIDPGKIGDKERNRLVDMALDRGNQADYARERSGFATAVSKDNGKER